MKRNGALLARIGAAMFGEHWLNPLSAGLGVNVRTVRRWRDDDFDIPDGIWPLLAALCKQRAVDLFKLFHELEPHQKTR